MSAAAIQADETINIADAVYLISYVLRAGPPPVPYWNYGGDAPDPLKIGDINDDAVYLISYIFRSEPEPIVGCAEKCPAGKALFDFRQE